MLLPAAGKPPAASLDSMAFMSLVISLVCIWFVLHLFQVKRKRLRIISEIGLSGKDLDVSWRLCSANLVEIRMVDPLSSQEEAKVSSSVRKVFGSPPQVATERQRTVFTLQPPKAMDDIMAIRCLQPAGKAVKVDRVSPVS